MINTTDIVVGQIVRSKAGRDKDEFFIVLEVIDKEYVSLANGKSRTIARPKKKKVKHISVTHEVVDLNEETNVLNDRFLRKKLSPYQEA